jgi:hypothetical protein
MPVYIGTVTVSRLSNRHKTGTGLMQLVEITETEAGDGSKSVSEKVLKEFPYAPRVRQTEPPLGVRKTHKDRLFTTAGQSKARTPREK